MENLRSFKKVEKFRSDIINYVGAVKYPISVTEIMGLSYLNLLRLSNKIDDFYNINLLNAAYSKG